MLFAFYFILTIIVALTGLIFLFGMGWGLFIFELISGTLSSSHPSSYVDLQKDFKKYKRIEYKILGLILLILSGVLFYYTGEML